MSVRLYLDVHIPLAITEGLRRRGTKTVDFAGLIYAHQLGPGIGEIVEELELLSTCTEAQEIRNRIIFLPLR